MIAVKIMKPLVRMAAVGTIIDGEAIVKMNGGGEEGLKALQGHVNAGNLQLMPGVTLKSAPVTVEDLQEESIALHNRIMALEEERDKLRVALRDAQAAYRVAQQEAQRMNRMLEGIRDGAVIRAPQTRAEPNPHNPSVTVVPPAPMDPIIRAEPLSGAAQLDSLDVREPVPDDLAGIVPKELVGNCPTIDPTTVRLPPMPGTFPSAGAQQVGFCDR